MTGPSANLSPNSRGSSTSGPLYDLRRNPPYLVDFTSVLSGKRVAATKRRVRFRFGFSNAEALASGATGIECRGCEHDVTLVWSHTSGKRLVVADGKEVHFSVGKPTQGKFQFTWTMRGNHTLKLIAHAAPPLQAKQPGWKQFDLQLDGMSVFDFPRIFELGIKAGGRGGDSRALARRSPPRDEAGREPYSNYAMPKEDEMAWARSVERYENRRNVDRLSYPPSKNAPPGLDASTTGVVSPRAEVSDRPVFAEGSERRSFAEPPPASAAAPSTDLVSDAVPTAAEQDIISAPNALENGVANDEFAPQPVAPPPAPTYQDVATYIVASYGQAPEPAPAQQAAAAALPALPPSTNYEQPPAPAVAPAPAPAQEQAYYSEPPAQHPPAQEQQYYQQPPAQTYEQPPQQNYEQQQQAYYQQQAPAPIQTQPYDQQQQYYQQQAPAVVTPSYSADGTAPYQSPDAAQYNYQQENQPPADLGAYQESPTGVEAIDNQPFNQDQDVDDVTKAMKNLVNLEDINAAPEESLENMREAMVKNPFAERNIPQSKIDKLNKSKSPKSTPLPPAGQGYMLAGKSLAEVQSVTREHKPSEPSKEVMKPNAYNAGGHGMMVVYGQPGQGPPALHQPQGFGVGATLQNGGYGASQGAPQQQQQYAQQSAY